MTVRNVYRCHTCGYDTIYWARIQRHMDEEHGGGRIDNLTESVPTDSGSSHPR